MTPTHLRPLLVLLAVALFWIGCEAKKDNPAEASATAEPNTTSEAQSALPKADAESKPAAASDAEDPPTRLNGRAIADPKTHSNPDVPQVGSSPEGVGVAVGSMVADFSAQDAAGKAFAKADLVAKGPALVVFYRGGW